MLDLDQTFVNEEFTADSISSVKLDKALAAGWRHFGTLFFRYNVGFYRFDIRNVIPLRIRLSDFSPTKSQRRILRKNEDLCVTVQPAEIDEASEELFYRHKRRFDHAVPNSIYDFLSADPSITPCEGKEVRVYDSEKLLAVSYFDIGEKAASGIYAMFEPEEQKRALGIFTLLKEIEFSITAGKEFYYLGYCYEGESFYDYKKRFRGTEAYDWNDNWKSIEFTF